MSKCNVWWSLMFIYINVISYYNRFPCFNSCLSVMFGGPSCSFTSMLFPITACSLCFNLCLSVMFGGPSCSFTYHFLLNIVPILGVISETKYMICRSFIDREFQSDNLIIRYDCITNLSEVKWKIYFMNFFTPIISLYSLLLYQLN